MSTFIHMQICTKIVIKILEKWRFSINTRQNMRLVPQSKLHNHFNVCYE